ncbi:MULTISPECIES: ribonuclease D [unclassified Xanthobacter]|uniref:ribonuclease D n=1 Tax=unclassified Xanthobacter TaxID=2623496 RepID=UPI001F43693D|nr:MULTISPECIES: ribonuclease D [unclassified Xanthobacter]
MDPITTTDALTAACERLARHPFVTVDTEFLRETTFWPKLCVVQVASPEEAIVVDALAHGLDLTPFYRLMADKEVMKVFHAGRQDIEIIWHLARLIPHPVFDTQVAAMVLGYGDSISYDQLVQRVCGHAIDKSSRFTDWSRRPLSPAQLVYAMTDVTHLRDIYVKLTTDLDTRGRGEWVGEEMHVLTSPSTYDQNPDSAWERLKSRVRKPRELAVLVEVAAWREREAQTRDLPRGRVIKDEVIGEIAVQQPQTPEKLSELRSLPKGFERSRYGEAVIEAVKRGIARDPRSLPRIERDKPLPNGASATVELLKVLLRMTAEQNAVAAKVLATTDDLERIAVDDEADVPALKGWRRELFGERALALKAGRIALAVEKGRVIAVER